MLNESEEIQTEGNSGISIERIAFIEGLVAQGGPKPTEYDAFTAWTNAMADDVSKGRLAVDDLLSFWHKLTQQVFRGTVQGDVVLKPHGYHGDFETIDAIYTQRVNRHPTLERWDRYFHAQSAPRAVRNRKTYFHSLLSRSEMELSGEAKHPQDKLLEARLRVLNVGSGPGRDMLEWFESNPNTKVRFDCVELDTKAIRYASELCEQWVSSIRFYQVNALRFKSDDRYNLIWSAGLFDYLSDAMFVRLLRIFLQHCLPGGEIVVGNFGDQNSTRNYMELLGGWRLIHRSCEHLAALSQRAGVSVENIRIDQEPEGVNLFLHIRVPCLQKC